MPREYWSLSLALAAPGSSSPIGASLTRLRGERLRQFDITSAAAASAAAASLPREWRVTKVSRKQRQRGPPAPYNTASLQQDASRRLGIAVSDVMRRAQALYEGVTIGSERVALITYMRTDGIQISEDGVSAIRDFISAEYGGDEAWLPPKPRQFVKKARNAQV